MTKLPKTKPGNAWRTAFNNRFSGRRARAIDASDAKLYSMPRPERIKYIAWGLRRLRYHDRVRRRHWTMKGVL
jgi:hypothetical protein